MRRFPIHNHSKSSITEKRWNKANYLTQNSTRLKFFKKTTMQNSFKILGYIKCYGSISPKPVKNLSNSIRYYCQNIYSWSRRTETILEMRKKASFLQVINKPIIYNFFKDFSKHGKKTNRVVVFSCRPFSNILKYKDHWWDRSTICKTRLLQYLRV